LTVKEKTILIKKATETTLNYSDKR